MGRGRGRKLRPITRARNRQTNKKFLYRGGRGEEGNVIRRHLLRPNLHPPRVEEQEQEQEQVQADATATLALPLFPAGTSVQSAR